MLLYYLLRLSLILSMYEDESKHPFECEMLLFVKFLIKREIQFLRQPFEPSHAICWTVKNHLKVTKK